MCVLIFSLVEPYKEIFGRHSSKTTRTFLLVVALGYELLAVILETGVGGCNESRQSQLPVRPDPFYVDQAASTLEHLEEMGIPLVCERWLTLPHNPDLLDIGTVPFNNHVTCAQWSSGKHFWHQGLSVAHCTFVT